MKIHIILSKFLDWWLHKGNTTFLHSFLFLVKKTQETLLARYESIRSFQSIRSWRICKSTTFQVPLSYDKKIVRLVLISIKYHFKIVKTLSVFGYLIFSRYWSFKTCDLLPSCEITYSRIQFWHDYAPTTLSIHLQSSNKVCLLFSMIFSYHLPVKLVFRMCEWKTS